MSSDSATPLFIMGAPRTATTLAGWIFRQHPQCWITYELRPVTFLYHTMFPPVPSLNTFITHFATWGQRGAPMGPELLVPLGRVVNDKVDPFAAIRGMHHGLRATYAEQLDRPLRVFGDKSPSYCTSWYILREVFPGCRIVHTKREFGATVDSVMRQNWGCSASRAMAETHVRTHEDKAAECPDAWPLQLEELEAQPEKHITALLEFAGLDVGVYPMSPAVHYMLHGKGVN